MEEMRNESMTLSEFSKKINVSSATVSSVFNNKYGERGIPEKTADFVRTQAGRLGYSPNLAAKRLRLPGGKVYELAVLTSYEAPFQVFSNLVRTLEATAKALYSDLRFYVEVIMFHSGRISELPGILDGSRFNGAVITNTNADDDRFFMENEVGCPLVFLGREIPGYSCVLIDPQDMGGLAAAELVEQCGCSKIAVVEPSADRLTQATKGRAEGFLQWCRKRQIECTVIQAAGLDERSGFEAIGSYLDVHSLDGIFCVSDFLAVGAYSAIKQRNLSVPDDVAVVGIGDISSGEFLEPSLTVFRKDRSDLQDVHASKILLEQLLGRRIDKEIRVMQTSIVRRGSTAKQGRGIQS